MQLLLLEPFFTGSHKSWAQAYQRVSSHQVEIMSLSGHYWKWRMHGGALTLARKLLASGLKPDMILATDMLDLTSFLALTRKQTVDIPVAMYFHENQLTYPRSARDTDRIHNRDNHYAFINYTSALAADLVCFNSQFHYDSFFEALPAFLKSFPDKQGAGNAEVIRRKSRVLPLGLDLRALDAFRPHYLPPPFGSAQRDGHGSKSRQAPLILWNHRWEYDKNPEAFFQALFDLQERGLDFRLAMLGEAYSRQAPIFEVARERLDKQIVHWGYVETGEAYARWLWEADILPVTSRHDFFGKSVVEAIYCGCMPLLPDRLAYPGHIPPELYAHCLYADQEAFISKLEEWIVTGLPAVSERLRKHVHPYDWSVTGPVYDHCFSEAG